MIKETISVNILGHWVDLEQVAVTFDEQIVKFFDGFRRFRLALLVEANLLGHFHCNFGCDALVDVDWDGDDCTRVSGSHFLNVDTALGRANEDWTLNNGK